MSSLMSLLKRSFVSGVVVVVPLIITYLVLKLLFEAIDGILQPWLHRLFDYYVPGLGLLVTLLLVLLAGILTRNLIGARLYQFGDRILARVPIVRPVYSAAKQLLEAVAMPSMESFRDVVLLEYPRHGIWSLGFVAGRPTVAFDGQPETMLSVFVPSTPTPISGMVVLVRRDQCIFLQMSVEEGIKFLVSGGVVSPTTLQRKQEPSDQEGRRG